MDEKKIQKRLKKTIIFVAATGVILLAAAGFFGWFLWHSVDQAVNEQMSAETDEYIKRLYKQMHANFQLLDTLSSFVADAEIQEKEEFPELLDEANHQNDFITMGYFDESGDGVTVTLDEGIEMTTIEACQEEFKEAFARALTLGKPIVIDCQIGSDDKVWPMVAPGAAISEAFDGKDLEQQK